MSNQLKNGFVSATDWKQSSSEGGLEIEFVNRNEIMSNQMENGFVSATDWKQSSSEGGLEIEFVNVYENSDDTLSIAKNCSNG